MLGSAVVSSRRDLTSIGTEGHELFVNPTWETILQRGYSIEKSRHLKRNSRGQPGRCAFVNARTSWRNPLSNDLSDGALPMGSDSLPPRVRQLDIARRGGTRVYQWPSMRIWSNLVFYSKCASSCASHFLQAKSRPRRSLL